MTDNGELQLAHAVIRSRCVERQPLIVVDIGANLGKYALAVADAALAEKVSDSRFLLLEASGDTVSLLQQNVGKSPHARQMTTIQCAASDKCGVAQFNVIAPGAGRNSLLPVEDDKDARSETVQLITVDALLDERQLPHVDLMKIDTEGHDFAVLLGARESLGRGRIGVVQFEYNWRWMEQRAYLRDVFRLIADLPYSLGKVTPDGIEFFDKWYQQFETLVENNYALVRDDLVDLLTRIPMVSNL